jgi:hypothetical protein
LYFDSDASSDFILTLEGHMPEWLNSAAMIIAEFFLISLSVETLLDSLRGVLSIIGINVLKAERTLEEGLAAAAEFVPEGSREYARFEAFVRFVEQASARAGTTFDQAKAIVGDFGTATTPEEKDAVIEKWKAVLASAAEPIKAAMQKSEEKRVFVLRIISAGLGVAVAIFADFDVTRLGDTGDAPVSLIGCALAGLAAAGGSSFWHDQLDRVRNLKQAGQQLLAVRSQ